MLESLLGFFALGTWGFFLYVVFLSIVYTVSVECDKHGFAILATILGIALLWKPISLLFQNWQFTLIGILAYGVIGGVWSIFRWFMLCKKIIAENPYKNRASYTKHQTKEEYYQFLIKPKDHKSQLISWVIYWPWSFLWNILGDFFTGIYKSLSTIYDHVAKVVINKAIKGS